MARRDRPPKGPTRVHLDDGVTYLFPGDLAAIEEHLTSHLGEPSILHEIESADVHLDLYCFEPTESRPRIVSTVGMSARPMSDGRRCELTVCLPPSWSLDFDTYGDRAFWPMRTLKDVARAVLANGFPLNPGETLAFGDPPDPLAAHTHLSAVLIAGTFEPPPFGLIPTRMGDVELLTIIPITTPELRYKQEHGTHALMDRLGEARVDPIVDADRPCPITGARPG